MSDLKFENAVSENIENSDLETIREWYQTRNAGVLTDELFASDVVWEVAEGFPYGGTYRGSRDVLENFFPRLAADFEFLRAELNELLAADSLIVGIGIYRGRAKHTKLDVTAPFVHLWRVQNSRVVWFRNYTDTLLFARALT